MKKRFKLRRKKLPFSVVVVFFLFLAKFDWYFAIFKPCALRTVLQRCIVRQ